MTGMWAAAGAALWSNQNNENFPSLWLQKKRSPGTGKRFNHRLFSYFTIWLYLTNCRGLTVGGGLINGRAGRELGGVSQNETAWKGGWGCPWKVDSWQGEGGTARPCIADGDHVLLHLMGRGPIRACKPDVRTCHNGLYPWLYSYSALGPTRTRYTTHTHVHCHVRACRSQHATHSIPNTKPTGLITPTQIIPLPTP